jgi:hypothetical protein
MKNSNGQHYFLYFLQNLSNVKKLFCDFIFACLMLLKSFVLLTIIKKGIDY